MKRLFVLFCPLAFIIAFTGCHLKAKRAKQYHDVILQSVQQVIDNSLSYGDSIHSYQKASAIKAQEQYIGIVNKSVSTVEAAKDFEGDTVLQQYSLELLNFYKATLDRELSPFLHSIKSESFSAEETQAADSLYDKWNMRATQYWDRFDWAEKKFYKQYEIGKVEK